MIGKRGAEANMIAINGMAHVILAVSNWDQCKEFYEAFLPFLGLNRVFSGQDMIYYVGGRTALGVSRCDDQYARDRFVQNSVGLHHLCFRARNKADVDTVYAFLKECHAKIVHPPEEGPWAPGYYSVLFEDPAGIRLEINYVPGQGVLAEGAHFDPAGDYH
jgi:catechol 2,3-dioxygenase-like lactoylglutathione lyase family enzyme